MGRARRVESRLMRYLFYTNYQSGQAGLSNGIMSVEIGVVLAHLSNRLLVLDGNASPPANVVAYDGRVSNLHPSRITDLLDIPVPWAEPADVDLKGLESIELTDWSLGDCTFYFPTKMDLSTSDARSFARGRSQWVAVSGEHDRVPVLRLSEDPISPGDSSRRRNLCYYSYQFYLDDEARRSVYRLLQRMQPKPAFLQLAQRVARDIGPFNAVHLRRGDFKFTYGVTTLDRKPSEAIDAMDQLFSRDDPLVIVTDERDDPFFMEIKLAFPRHFFIDWHILDHYGEAFASLPRTDSLSLAFLSQLVAAEAKEFLGTMTSTFTGMIQRSRGNRGKRETFRYLWNELPEAGQDSERGRHAVSDCISLDRGEMLEQFQGPYSWNRVSQLLNPAWMREWPESFLTPETLTTGVLATKFSSGKGVLAPSMAAAGQQPVIHVSFENIQVAVWCKDTAILKRLAVDLGVLPQTQARSVIASFEVFSAPTGCWIEQRGLAGQKSCEPAQLHILLKQMIVAVFAQARHAYAWIAAAAFSKGGRGLVIAGETGEASNSLLLAMQKAGWEALDSGLLAIRIEDLMIIPLCARTQPEGAGAHRGRNLTPLAGLVVATQGTLHMRDTSLTTISPAAAVTALIGATLGAQTAPDRALRLLCRVVEQRPVAQFHWSHAQQGVQVLSQWVQSLDETAA